MPDYATTAFTVNGRTYHPPARPIVVICLDGSADEYLDCALARGRMPHLLKMVVEGYRGRARGALPSFTNVNNASIVTGTPPSVHGISGNFFLDPESGEEVMMNSARYLRAETILAAAARAGRAVAMVTAKEKLRDILSHDLKGIAFSSEKANQAQESTHGITDVEALVGRPTPPIYSPEASLFVLQAGVALLAAGRADFLYLSLTDYMQHKYAPETPEALDFYAAIDAELGRLLEQGAILGLTADHGMNAKQTLSGQPNVLYLEDLIVAEFGPDARVILPITDPYVLHHGALGSFAVVHLPAAQIAPVAQWLMQREGITEVYDRATAMRKLELPEDRIGDLVVMSGRNVVLGRTPAYHDLSLVAEGLRSHGGRYEEMVPLVLSEPLHRDYAARAAGDPRNFDIFDFTVNGSHDV
jgi:phosphonoacetate hydrolase